MRTKSNQSQMKNRIKSHSKGSNLQELFVKELKDLYNAETQLIKALPKLAKAASSMELKEAFEDHLEETQEHANRLEKILSEFNEKAAGVKCEGMKGLITEGEETIKEEPASAIKDLALIAAAQKAEHYEIAAYGTVRTFAETLGLHDAVDLLQQTLDEEGEADKILTGISTSILSQEDASSESSTQEESSNSEDEDN